MEPERDAFRNVIVWLDHLPTTAHDSHAHTDAQVCGLFGRLEPCL